MKRRRRILLVASVGLIGVVWFFFARSHEPRYEGKPVSYWFKEYCLPAEDDGHSRPEAAVALGHIGTNALPYLVSEAFGPKEDSAFRRFLIELRRDYPHSRILPRVRSRRETQEFAAEAISNIKPRSEVLLPLIRPFLLDPNSSDCAQAVWLLARAATNGQEFLVPYFTSTLNSTNGNVCYDSLDGLWKLGPSARGAIPDLLALLRDSGTTNTVRSHSARVLAHIGDNSPRVLAAIASLFKDENCPWNVRCMAAADLCKLDSGQVDAFRFLTKSLTNDQEPHKVRWAAYQLEYVGSNALPAISILLEAMGRTNQGAWTAVMKTLDEFKVPRDEYLPAIKAQLNSPNEESRYEAAEIVLKEMPSNIDAMQVMLKEVNSGTNHVMEAAIAISTTGSNALPAIPSILAMVQRESAPDWIQLSQLLEKLSVLDATFLAGLKENLKAPDELKRILIASAILEVIPADPDARVTLVEMLKQKRHQQEAIQGLSLAGPFATDALPLLRQALKSEDSDVRKTAAYAITRIGVKEPAK